MAWITPKNDSEIRWIHTQVEKFQVEPTDSDNLNINPYTAPYYYEILDDEETVFVDGVQKKKKTYQTYNIYSALVTREARALTEDFAKAYVARKLYFHCDLQDEKQIEGQKKPQCIVRSYINYSVSCRRNGDNDSWTITEQLPLGIREFLGIREEIVDI